MSTTTPTRTTIAKPTDRDAWLAARRPYFNASSASVLFNRHPFQTAGDYAAVKLSGREQEQTTAMRRGQILEAPVGDWWAEQQGYHLIEPAELFVAGVMMATVDRIVVEHDRPVEIKTTAERVSEPVPYWLDQCQAIMWCHGSDTLDLVWFDASMDLQWIVVDADATLQTEMAERAERFMAAIELGIVPDWVELSSRNVATIYPDPEGAVDVGERGVELVRRFVNLKEQRKELDEDIDATRDAVVRLIGDHEVATFDGEQVASFKASAGYWTIEAKTVREQEPEVFERLKVWRDGTRRFVTRW